MIIKQLVIMVSMFLLVGCGISSQTDDDKKNVVVTVLPQKYFVEKIAGDLVNVTVMVDQGDNHETYEPKPSQMLAVEKASLYIKVGMLFESAWLPKFTSLNPKLTIADQAEGVRLIKFVDIHDIENESRENNDGTEKEEFEMDPHIWLSVKQAQIQAQNVLKALIAIAPENEKIFEQNYAVFVKEIESLDADLTKIFSKSNVSAFLVMHPSLGYLAEDYGLTQYAVENAGQEPSAEEYQELISIAKANKLTSILVERQSSKNEAQIFASYINANLVEIDPLAEFWAENLRQLGKIIVASE